MVSILVNHGFRTIAALVCLAVFVWGWVWLADRFFDCPTTDLSVQYEHGASALTEQVAAALYTPAWLVWEFAFSGWRGRTPMLDRGPLLLLCILQLWPAFVLAFRPWDQLSRRSRRVVLGYGGFCLISAISGFTILHTSWERFFGP